MTNKEKERHAMDDKGNVLGRNRTWFRLGPFFLMLYFACPAAIPVFAQQGEPSSPVPQAEAELSNLSTPHMFSYSPMTRQERWQDYERQNFESYGAFFQALFTGLGDYLGNVPRWDSGMAGLSEHVGSEFASFTIGGTIHSSLAAALHQDTRYFHCSCRGGLHRTLHAASRSIFTYGDNGHIYPDVSGLAGIYGGSMLTTEWYQGKYTATGYGVRQANIAVGITSAIYVIREFSPEIKRALHSRKQEAPVPGR
jgi:hypothetical protein